MEEKKNRRIAEQEGGEYNKRLCSCHLERNWKIGSLRHCILPSEGGEGDAIDALLKRYSTLIDNHTCARIEASHSD